MSIWNKILIGLILVTSLVFFFFSARALKTHQVWRTSVIQHEEAIEAAEAERKVLEGGDEAEGVPSIRQLELQVHTRMLDRGRAWYHVEPQQVTAAQDPNTGQPAVQVTVKPDLPDPHRITPQTVLFAFDETPFEQGGRYLGQFTVTSVVENGPVQMTPSMKLTKAEFDRVKASQTAGARWTLYEVMPKDEEAVLAGLTDDQLRALFPGPGQEEYLAEGERELRDYEVLFNEYRRQRTELVNRLNAVRLDKKYLGSALANAETQEQMKQQQIDAAKTEVENTGAERDMVATHLAALQARLDKAQQGIADLIRANKSLAAELARIQAEAIRQADQRTREMAQASGA